MSEVFIKWIIEILIVGAACAFGGYGLGFKQALKSNIKRSTKSKTSSIKTKPMED